MKLKSATFSNRRLFSLRKNWLKLLSIAFIIVGLVLFAHRTQIVSSLGSTLKKYGHGAYRSDIRLSNIYSGIPFLWFKSLSHSADIPAIQLDIKFADFQKLIDKRKQSLEQGIIHSSSIDFVPATIIYDNKRMTAKVRLKGDMTDHLESDKWSLRIHIKGDNRILNMKKFSIQHPKIRDYHLEQLFYKTLDQYNIMHPRYHFVNVTINGKQLGIMALEEHFTNVMSSHNSRRDGIILRFDESPFWNEYQELASFYKTRYFNKHYNARIDVYDANKINKSPYLSTLRDTAIGLMRGYIEGKLPADQVFDAQKFGQFLAVSEFWGSWHNLQWFNLRFWFNPITLKLEPIGYDSELRTRINPNEVSVMNHQWLTLMPQLIKNKSIQAHYLKTIRHLSDEFLHGFLKQELINVENRQLNMLRSEFFMLQPYPWYQLEKRARFYHNISMHKLNRTPIDGRQYHDILNAYIIPGKQPMLELHNLLPHDINITDIKWVHKSNSSFTVPFDDSKILPILIKATPKGTLTTPQRLSFKMPKTNNNLVLTIDASIDGRDKTYTIAATTYSPTLSRHPIPSTTIDKLLSEHPYLKLIGKSKTIAVKVGTWNVTSNLIIPVGYSLHLASGTTLQFSPKSMLISHGPVHLQGTKEQPILFTSIYDKWPGLVVMNAPNTSSWRHVTIKNTTIPYISSWPLTGGVTFLNSDIDMENVSFYDNDSEDALNIIHSDFNLNHLLIKNAKSDGLDADFSQGQIKNSNFEYIGSAGGGDAVDISGSKVLLSASSFNNISDKAISVGEKSSMTAVNITMNNVGTGAVSKDGSQLEISHSTINHAQYAGLMAYIKKIQYQPANIIAKAVSITNTDKVAYVQFKSSIIMDGKSIPQTKLDVKRLYQTIMKKGIVRQ